MRSSRSKTSNSNVSNSKKISSNFGDINRNSTIEEKNEGTQNEIPLVSSQRNHSISEYSIEEENEGSMAKNFRSISNSSISHPSSPKVVFFYNGQNQGREYNFKINQDSMINLRNKVE